MRYAALAYALWVLSLLVMFWSDAAFVARVHSFWAKMPLTEASVWQRVAGFALSFVDWLLLAAAVCAVWELMGAYLEGRIFSPDAAKWLRRIGLFGLAALALDIVLRPVMTAISSMHMPEGMRVVALHFQPNDLLNTLFLLAFVALGHIFKSAADLADDHAQIV